LNFQVSGFDTKKPLLQSEKRSKINFRKIEFISYDILFIYNVRTKKECPGRAEANQKLYIANKRRVGRR